MSASLFGDAAAVVVANTFTSIAALRQINSRTNTSANVLGYYTSGDGGGGPYYLDVADLTSVDNGGTIIVAVDGGRWKLNSYGMVGVNNFGAIGDGVANDTAAIQAAFDALNVVNFPYANKTYLISAPINITKHNTRVIGNNWFTTIIKGNHAGVIFQVSATIENPVIQFLRFKGAGCTGIAVAAGGGPLVGYLIRPRVTLCEFDWEMAYGINADMIFGVIDSSRFGYFGDGTQPAPGASTMCGIRSIQVSSNASNVNVIRNCLFAACGGLTSATASVHLEGGTGWKLDTNDWERGGVTLYTNNITNLQLTGGNWMESCVATTALMEIQNSPVPVLIDGLNVIGGTCQYILKSDISGGTVAGLTIRNSSIVKIGTTTVFFDTTSTSTGLPANGNFAFYSNTVSGGAAGDQFTTNLDFRGGKLSPRCIAVIDTTGAGTILSCTDSSATITRFGVGDVQLNPSRLFGTSANNISAFVSGVSSPSVETFSATVATNAVRVRRANSTGTLTDGIINVIVYGS